MSEILTIENCSSICIKGAVKVISSTATQAVVETSENLIVITGNNLEVKKLDLENQDVLFVGKVTNIKYSPSHGEKVPLFKRIFK